MRIIPKTAKVKIEFFKKISVADVVIGLAVLALEVLLFTTNIPAIPKYAIMAFLLAFAAWLYMPFDGQRFYMMFVNMVKYVFSVKKYSKDYTKANASIDNFIAFKDIKDGFIVYDEYYAGVLEIDPREFRLLSGYKQDQIIDVHFGKIIRSISGNTKASIVKIDRKMMLDKYIIAEQEKERQLQLLFDAGSIDENERFVRQKIIADRIAIYQKLSGETVLRKPFYYLVVYDKDQSVIREILTSGISNFIEAGMNSRVLDDKGLALFLKYNFTDNFEESDIEVLDRDELMAWVKDRTEKIKAKGGVVICGTHRPIITPSPAYAVMGKGNTFHDGEKRIRELADMGIRLFFSGHTHIQKMKEVVSDKGNKIYSVQTSSLAGFPPKMRKITIDTDNSTVDIRTIDLDLPELELGMSFTEYARKGFLGIVESIPYNMEHNIEAFLETDGGITLPRDLIIKYPKVVMFLGKKVNGLTYGKIAKFSKKYHDLTDSGLAAVKDKKFTELVFSLVSNLYKGNAAYSPDTAEYKIMMGFIRKIEKLLSIVRFDIRKVLEGYTLTEFIEPLLYNSGLDDDNVSLKVDFT